MAFFVGDGDGENAMLKDGNIMPWKHYGPLRGESTNRQWISLKKDQWCGTLMFPLLSARTSRWTNTWVPGDLRRTHVTQL